MDNGLDLLVSVIRLSVLLRRRLSEMGSLGSGSGFGVLSGWSGLGELDCYLHLTIEKLFVDIIYRVPLSEEEAEFIVAAVEMLVSENPSLGVHLETQQEEYKAIINDLKHLGLRFD